MKRFLTRTLRADGGLAAIEFALIAPVMIVTFFGVSEIANYILAARKIATVASTAADLVTQGSTINDTQMNDVMGALSVILRPFNPNDAQIRISQVVADSDGALTIDWSDARNTAPYVEGSPPPAGFPDDIVPNNQGIIMAEVNFTYQTPFGMFLNNGATVTDTFYLKPRRSTMVLRQ